MKKISLLLFLFLFGAAPLAAGTANYSMGFSAGIMPSYGGNLYSTTQAIVFDSNTGVDGINKSLSGFNTKEVQRLFGISCGVDFKAVFFDYFLLRVGGNYSMSVYGGEGKGMFDDAGTETVLKCGYSMTSYDVPLTLGLVIPFWKDVKISFSCGLAYAYGQYKNDFEWAAGERKGSFSGWALPLVLMLEGEYFIGEKFALKTTLAYYKGATETIKDGTSSDTTGLAGAGAVDFAKIDFTGYRFSLGISYYFYSI